MSSLADPGGEPAAMSPTERLALSRERLRRAMGPKGRRDTSSTEARPAGAWLDGLKSSPVGAILTDAITRWWSQHPLRLAGMVAADATGAMVRPLAQRHPLGLVLGALLLGGALAWSRPWRWLLTPALLAGLVPQLFSKLMALVPPQSWMAVLASLTQEQRNDPQPGQRPPAGPPGQAPVAGSKNE